MFWDGGKSTRGSKKTLMQSPDDTSSMKSGKTYFLSVGNSREKFFFSRFCFAECRKDVSNFPPPRVYIKCRFKDSFFLIFPFFFSLKYVFNVNNFWRYIYLPIDSQSFGIFFVAQHTQDSPKINIPFRSDCRAICSMLLFRFRVFMSMALPSLFGSILWFFSAISSCKSSLMAERSAFIYLFPCKNTFYVRAIPGGSLKLIFHYQLMRVHLEVASFFGDHRL